MSSSSNETSKHAPRSDDEPEAKKQCLYGIHGKPDIVVIVGGKKFYEHSSLLRQWSGYFDAAFRSGMKETHTMTSTFPEMNPDEWELIMSLLVPFSNNDISIENIHIFLPWFHLLCVTRGLTACDEFLCGEDLRGDSILDVLPLGIECGMTRFIEKCFKNVPPIIPELTLKELEKLCCILKQHEEFCDKFWEFLEPFLGKEVLPSRVTDPKDLIGTNLLPVVLYAGVKTKAEKGLSESLCKIAETVGMGTYSWCLKQNCTRTRVVAKEEVQRHHGFLKKK